MLLCLLLCPAESWAVSASADANGTTGWQNQIDAGLRNDFMGGSSWVNLAPEVSLTRRVAMGQAAIWSGDPAGDHLVIHYGAGLGLTGKPESRAQFARSLLLPGNGSIAWGAAIEHGDRHGIRVVVPDIGVEAKAFAWGRETIARQFVVEGGAGVSAGDRVGLSLQISRAVNGIGSSDRRRVLDALGGPGSWATSVSAEARTRLSPADLWCVANFAAYLGDSKYSVVPNGRRVISLGIMKGL